MWTLMKKSVLLTWLVFAGLSIMPFSVATKAVASNSEMPLQLILEALPPLQLTGQQIQLVVRFKNVSNIPIKLLKVFEPTPVFFSVKIIDRVSDRPIDVAGAGKIDFFGAPDVEVINPNQEFTVKIDLGQLLAASGKTLKRGLYEVSVTYHNQYGEDVLKGELTSGTVQIRILDKAE